MLRCIYRITKDDQLKYENSFLNNSWYLKFHKFFKIFIALKPSLSDKFCFNWHSVHKN